MGASEYSIAQNVPSCLGVSIKGIDRRCRSRVSIEGIDRGYSTVSESLKSSGILKFVISEGQNSNFQKGKDKKASVKKRKVIENKKFLPLGGP